MEFSYTFSGVARKELTAEEQERVIEALRVLLRDTFHGNQSALMRVHPFFKQAYVSRLLSGKAQPGWGFARKLAGIIGVTPDELVTGQKPKPLGPRFRDIPGWDDVERQAIELEPTMADHIRRVGNWYQPEPISSISVDRVIDAALLLKRISRR